MGGMTSPSMTGQRGVRTMTTPHSSPPTGSGLTTVSMAVDVRRASPGGRHCPATDTLPGPTPWPRRR